MNVDMKVLEALTIDRDIPLEMFQNLDLMVKKSVNILMTYLDLVELLHRLRAK